MSELSNYRRYFGKAHRLLMGFHGISRIILTGMQCISTLSLVSEWGGSGAANSSDELNTQLYIPVRVHIKGLLTQPCQYLPIAAEQPRQSLEEYY